MPSRSGEVGSYRDIRPLAKPSLRRKRSVTRDQIHSPNESKAKKRRVDCGEDDRIPPDGVRIARRKLYMYLEDLIIGRPDFLHSDDAKLLPSSKTWRHKLQYEPLRVTKDNCLALQKLYTVFYRARDIEVDASERDSFTRLASTVGQFLRLAVARSVCAMETVYRTDVLFRCASERSLIECFTDFMVESRSSSVVLRKARHLKAVCQVAPEFMICESERSSLGRILQYLNTIISAHRKRTEQFDSHSPQQISLATIAEGVCGAIETLSGIMKKHGTKPLPRQSLSTWSSAFIAFLVFCSAGQTPQALCRIRICRERFEDDLQSAEDAGFVALSTLRGKRTTLVGMPLVILPTFCIPFLRFHTYTILPAVKRTTQSVEANHTDAPLLLNHLDGRPLQSWKISYEFGKFINCIDLKPFSIRSFRLTSISVFLQAFRRGGLLMHRAEEEFLDVMARHYNTRTEQLRRNTGYRGSLEHEKTARELTRFFNSVSAT